MGWIRETEVVGPDVARQVTAANGAAVALANVTVEPYVARLAADWLAHTPDLLWREVDGTLAFVDISGFTRLTELLASRGRVGAEQMSDILDSTFVALLRIAYRDGGDLIKWGGDAILLLFRGPRHAARAARAVYRMRARLRRSGAIRTGRGRVRLNMSAGIHSGAFFFALVGDPEVHRELIVSGPATSRTAVMESIAEADEIALSPQSAALVDPAVLGPRKGAAVLLAAEPEEGAAAFSESTEEREATPVDLASLIPPAIRAHLRRTAAGMESRARSAVPEPAGHGSADLGSNRLSRRTQMEHRRITVAFVQFSGTDALYSELGPVALATALDECVRTVQHATGAHGVTFFESDINADGGKIMLTAGAPTSTEYDEARMLRAARHIVDHGGKLQVRVGVNRGPVFAGDFGPLFRRTYSVKGDAVNLAARVMGKAEAGQVLATDRVLDRSKTRFETETLPPFRVKGKSMLIHASVVGRLLGSDNDEATGELVGREKEFAALRSALAAARSGNGQVVDLVGEPGIGKSELARALVSYATAGGGFAVHATRCDVYETTTPYWPFRALLRSVLSLSVTADEGATRAALTGVVQSAMPTLVPWLPLIATSLDIVVPPTAEVEALDSRFVPARLTEVTMEFLAHCLTEPTVLLVTDVHLMDVASADLLQALTRGVCDRPWMLVVTRREIVDGFHPEADSPAQTVKLTPLDAAASTALANRLLGDTVLTPGDVAAMVRRAAGNPLFLRELVTAVQGGASVGSLPDTVEAVIGSHIDRLDPDQRMLLRVAAVLGMSLSGHGLDELLRAAGLFGAHTGLGRLPTFIHEEPGDRYVFNNQLIRDTAYEGLPYRTRRMLHGHAGELIEADAGHPTDVAELLSLHYFNASRPSKAWEYSRMAGEDAAATFAFAEADELLGRAVLAARSVPGISAEDLIAVNTALGTARFRVGRQEQALAAFRTARRRMRNDPVGAARLLGLEAETLLRVGRHTVALATLSRGLRLLSEAEQVSGSADRSVPATATEAAEALTVRSRLEGFYSAVRESQGKYRQALAWARKAERHAEQSGDPAAIAPALEAVHSAMAMLGATPDRPYGELALALYEQLDDRAGQSRALNNMAVHVWSLGRGTDALQMFRRAEAVAAEAGDTAGAAATRYNIGDVLLQLGRTVEAESLLRELLPQLRGLGIADFHASALRGVGLAAAMSGRYDEGRELLDRARTALAELGEAAEVAETDAAIADALLHHGQTQQAADLAAAAADRANDLGAHHLLPRLLRLQGAALSDLGRRSEAVTVLARASALARVHSRIERGFILAERSRLAERDGDLMAAAALHEDSHVVLAELGFVGGGRYESGAIRRVASADPARTTSGS